MDDPIFYTKRARDGVRVSGGHLCVAEAPTEPAGETSNLRGPYGPR